MLNTAKTHSFGKIRTIFWPVYSYELMKLVPMVLMMFLICLNYSIIRNVKDTVVITAVGSGAEIIPFIKVWAMLPMAIVLTWIYAKLSNMFKRETVFYIIISIFISYFLLFAFLMYPHQELFRPTKLCIFLRELLPIGCKGLIAMINNWTCTLFYTMSELWSSIVISVLFWGLANEITSLKQANRFYGIINVASSFAAFAAGQTAIFFSRTTLLRFFFKNSTRWEQTFTTLIIVVSCSALLIMIVHYWMYRKIIPNQKHQCFNDSHIKKSTSKHKKLSLRESFRYLLNSKYLISLAILVLAYNLSINLAEVIWKSKVHSLYPNPQDFNIYLNKLTSIVGILSTLIAIFIPLLITRMGWTFMSLLTPITMLVTASGFFIFDFFNTATSRLPQAFDSFSPLVIAVFFGAANNVLTKAAKYSVFDASKEIAFIPLSKEARIKGKAAIDGVGSRMGKSGSSLIQQGLLLIFGSLSACTPWIALALIIIIATWTGSTLFLGKQFKILTAGDHAIVPTNEKPATVSA